MTRLSNRQFPLMQEFAELGPARYMSIERAQLFDQRPFRSFLVHKWISYVPQHGFHITRLGKQAWDEFIKTEIYRNNPSAPLTRLFDPLAYGLKQPYRHMGRNNVVPMRKTA